MNQFNTPEESEINLRTLMMEDDINMGTDMDQPSERVNQTLDDLTHGMQGGTTGTTESNYNNQQHHLNMIMMEHAQTARMEQTFEQDTNSLSEHNQQLTSSSGGNRTPQLNNRTNVSALVQSSSHERTQDLIQKKLGAHNKIQVTPVFIQSTAKQQRNGSNTQRSGAASARLKFITQGQTTQPQQKSSHTTRNLAHLTQVNNQAIPGRIMRTSTPS